VILASEKTGLFFILLEIVDMDKEILDEIPFSIDMDHLMKTLRIRENDRHRNLLAGLAEEAEAIAKPKGVFIPVYFDIGENDLVSIDEITFKSRVLRVNIEKAHRVFPFVATCGIELDEWALAKTDTLHSFMADSIKGLALKSALDYLVAYLKEKFALEKTAMMTPGSLEDWPIEEQKPLFSLLGDTEKDIGVRINESLLMIPAYSVSGISFPTEVNFQNCQLCPREKCPGRRAPYDKDLYERRYGEVRIEN